ncbi:unnamed protein product [Cyprideis torosa]|uniref:Splicing factor YJU2 n=1 Tax=Cyprideis torosa TaxID=163714 RepID=A0A7R8ZHW3_9CRUS|nr:unnamed protein product [Cyprideis torosa]CAG0883439.1 unnamed protein product [Cyprideis torosa]
MSERKVLNKYFPPDYDPSKIPRMKRDKNIKFCVRLMAPCNMRCVSCGEYVYKGKKFNARKEDVLDMNHLGLRIYRFYIRCPRCLQEISFRTDPETTDYVLEAGATRNFQALKLAEEAAEKELKEKEEEIKNNPMKLLEQRTEQSQREMEELEALEELRETNKRQATLNYEKIIGQKVAEGQRVALTQAEMEREEDEAELRRILGRTEEGVTVKRLLVDVSDSDNSDADDSTSSSGAKRQKMAPAPSTSKEKPVWAKSIGALGSQKKTLKGLIVKKKCPMGDVRVTMNSHHHHHVQIDPSLYRPIYTPATASAFAAAAAAQAQLAVKAESGGVTSTSAPIQMAATAHFMAAHSLVADGPHPHFMPSHLPSSSSPAATSAPVTCTAQPLHQQHVRNVLRGEASTQTTRVECSFCGQTFIHTEALQEHLRLSHTGTDGQQHKHTCSVCHKWFKDKYKLARHSIVHTEERPFSCNTCTSAFKSEYHLTRHLRIHSGERPFQCPHCHFSFGRSFHLKRHMYTHTGIKPYQCLTCDAVFKRSTDLKKHRLTHFAPSQQPMQQQQPGPALQQR